MKAKSLLIISTLILAFVSLSYAVDQPSGVETERPRSTAYRPNILVYKDHHCDCCEKWIRHLEAHRFVVRVENVDDMSAIKKKIGIPRNKDACHTALIEGYFVEGHVPADDIKRLIRTKPDAKGLIVPGMPLGSPGMEQGKMFQPYDVLLMDKSGNTTVFSHYSK